MNIKFRNVIPNPLKEYNNVNSLFNTEFEFISGNSYQLIAPSGKGKSTIIGLITGIRGDYSGEIYFGDKLISNFKSKDWSNWRSQNCSVIFQDLQLFGQLTAYENIMVNAEVQAMTKESGKKRINYELSLEKVHLWSEKLGVLDKLHQPVSILSFGQMQRIAIIRALNRDYKWLIFDEPFSHLDEANTQIAIDLILTESAIKNAGIIITALDERDANIRFQQVSV